MEITLLGTSSMAPTKERNHPALFLSHEEGGILFDCGEGTQRQLKIADIRLTRVTKILITHWHGDHVLGLAGFLQTLSACEEGKVLEIYGPKGTKKKVKQLFDVFDFDSTLDLKVYEVKTGVIFKSRGYRLESHELEHGVPVVGYAFIEEEKRKVNMKKAKQLGLQSSPLIGKLQDGKSVTVKGKKIQPSQVCSVVKGKKVAYITDTRLCDGSFALAKNADVLVCESTFSDRLKEKADEFFHLTAVQAAQLAQQSGVGKLVLTHFSARYKDLRDLEQEAKKHFESVVCGHDLLKVKV